MKQLNYVEKFRCIGGSCPDNCCIGWEVEIDQKTYKKYETVKNVELEYLFKKHLYVFEDSYDPEVDYAHVILKKNKQCPFLNEEHLCKIHAACGEDFLSNVCSTYPRMTNRIDGELEQTLSVSCPEAIKLMLFQEEPLHWVTLPNEPERKIVNMAFSTKASHFKKHPARHFHSIRKTTVDVLQNRRFSIELRLVLLGMFMTQLQEKIDLGKIAEIPNLCETYQRKDKHEALLKAELGPGRKKFDDLSHGTLQLQMMTIMLKQLKLNTDVDSEVFKQAMKSFISDYHLPMDKGAKTIVTAHDFEMAAEFKEDQKKYYQPYFDTREHFMENFLINHVYKNLYPFTESERVIEVYGLFVLRFIFIKASLIHLGALNKGLTDDLVASSIQVFSKVVEHHRSYLVELAPQINRLKRSDFDSMSALLKDSTNDRKFTL